MHATHARVGILRFEDDPMLARYMSEEGAAAYSRKYEKSLLRRVSNRRELSLVGRALDLLGARGHVLDAPCGAGRLLPVLLERAERVTGLDVSAPMLDLAAASVRGRVPEGRVRFERASVGALPFSDAAFDGVVCWRLLHHLTEPGVRARALAELRRVTRGGVVASFADASTFKARMRHWRRRARRSVALTPEALRSEAGAVGLRVERIWRLAGPFSHLSAAVMRPA